ncbi:MAG: NAD(P)-binding oxidoreductase, partial [Chloroflexota bacterium]
MNEYPQGASEQATMLMTQEALKIAILGATGQTGLLVAHEALKKEIDVVALARTPEKVTLQHDQLSIVKTEISNLDSTDVIDQLKTCGHVIIALGSTKLRGDAIRSDGTKAMLAALKNNGLSPRVWCISSAGTGDSYDQMPLPGKMIVRTFLRWVIQDHDLQEQAIRASGLPYTILRPTGLTNNPATHNYTVTGDAKLTTSQISRADVAHYLVSQLDRNDV